MEVGILYLALHNQLVKKYGAGHIIDKKEFFIKIGRHAQIPKHIRPLVLREMENLGFIEKIDKKNIRILSKKIDLENNVDELYKIAGIYLNN